jgi:hypothetical protein
MFQRIIVPASSGSNVPRSRIATEQKNVSYMSMADMNSRWPQKVASPGGWGWGGGVSGTTHPLKQCHFPEDFNSQIA